jgi:hypothetical protein
MEEPMHITPSRLMPPSVSSFVLLLVLAGPALAQQQQCSDWYINKILTENLHCSPQDIADICSGSRPRPPENATNCAAQAPATMAPLTGTPYEQFESLAAQRGIDLSQHPTYTEQYFESRAQLYCSQMSSGDSTQLLSAMSYPPVVNMTETANDRSGLELAILQVGTRAYCPNNMSNEQAFEQTYGRR